MDTELLHSRRAGEVVTGPPPPTMRATLGENLGWSWILLGLAGSIAMALTGPALITSYDGGATTWWFSLALPPTAGDAGNMVLFYFGMGALVVAWLGLGRRLRHAPGTTRNQLWLVAAIWIVPMLAAPPLFSRDVYSYMAQSTLAHLGLNPYNFWPDVLAAFNRGPLLQTVSPAWRSTVAPYGPLFLSVGGTMMGGLGTHLVAAATSFRLLDLVGIGLIAYCLPRLATRLGADPRWALWLGLLSPIVLLELVAAGHNDAIMIGLLAAGVTLAVERHPLLGIAACALATLVKSPAAAGMAFIAVSWARTQPDRAAKLRALLLSAGLGAAIILAISAASGLGMGWLSPGALSTPGQVYVGTTPTTAIGRTLASMMHLVDIGPTTAATIGLLRAAGLLGAGAFGALLLWRVRAETLVPYLALALLGVTLGGPVLWPWYLTWSFVLLAACRSGQRSRLLVVMVACFPFVVAPTGASLVSTSVAPLVAVVWVGAAVVAWRRWRAGAGRGPLLVALLGTDGAALVRGGTVAEASAAGGSAAGGEPVLAASTAGGKDARVAGPRELTPSWRSPHISITLDGDDAPPRAGDADRTQRKDSTHP